MIERFQRKQETNEQTYHFSYLETCSKSATEYTRFEPSIYCCLELHSILREVTINTYIRATLCYSLSNHVVYIRGNCRCVHEHVSLIRCRMCPKNNPCKKFSKCVQYLIFRPTTKQTTSKGKYSFSI